ncbi:MAG: DUF167 domain-containing protein [Candidatus Omnitrophica bacterium]|nr:DUF167 domain-containing protein [Candidatus Omnitrophota bacterium]
MLIKVRVIPKSSRSLVVKQGGDFKAYLTKPAQASLANEQLIELLSEFFHIRKYQVKIVKGNTSRNKLVEINA